MQKQYCYQLWQTNEKFRFLSYHFLSEKDRKKILACNYRMVFRSSIVIESPNPGFFTDENETFQVLKILEKTLKELKVKGTNGKRNYRPLNISDVVLLFDPLDPYKKIPYYYNGVDWTFVKDWNNF